MKPILVATFFTILTACATQDLVPGKNAAHFDQYPTRLFNVFETACSGPEHTFNRPSDDVYECRELLPPPATAAAILQYDGYPEDLPQLVIRFIAQSQDPGYRVDTELFLNVPRRSGAALRVIPSDPRISRRMSRLLRAAGGEPL